MMYSMMYKCISTKGCVVIVYKEMLYTKTTATSESRVSPKICLSSSAKMCNICVVIMQKIFKNFRAESLLSVREEGVGERGETGKSFLTGWWIKLFASLVQRAKTLLSLLLEDRRLKWWLVSLTIMVTFWVRRVLHVSSRKLSRVANDLPNCVDDALQGFHVVVSQ